MNRLFLWLLMFKTFVMEAEQCIKGSTSSRVSSAYPKCSSSLSSTYPRGTSRASSAYPFGTLRCKTAPPSSKSAPSQKNRNIISQVTLERLAIPKYSKKYCKQDQLRRRCASAVPRLQKEKQTSTFEITTDEWRPMTGTFQVVETDEAFHIADELHRSR